MICKFLCFRNQWIFDFSFKDRCPFVCTSRYQTKPTLWDSGRVCVPKLETDSEVFRVPVAERKFDDQITIAVSFQTVGIGSSNYDCLSSAKFGWKFLYVVYIIYLTLLTINTLKSLIQCCTKIQFVFQWTNVNICTKYSTWICWNPASGLETLLSLKQTLICMDYFLIHMKLFQLQNVITNLTNNLNIN